MYLTNAINPGSGGAFHGKGDHYAVRERICQCLAALSHAGGEGGGRALERCVYVDGESLSAGWRTRSEL